MAFTPTVAMFVSDELATTFPWSVQELWAQAIDINVIDTAPVQSNTGICPGNGSFSPMVLPPNLLNRCVRSQKKIISMFGD
jgi:hypothetical protein